MSDHARQSAARRGIPYRGRRAAGLTIVEMAAALGLVAVGASAVLLTLVYSLQLDATNRETAAATQTARRVVEELRTEDLADVLTRYNADDSDDPGGAGTAPGDRFDVPLLRQTAGGDAVDARIELPLDTDGTLRESADLPRFGFPRDLNGDGTIDDDDRAGDLLALPVAVRVTWEGVNGERSIEYRTVLR